MHLKHKGYCVGVLLIYTISTISLPPVGWCEPTVNSAKTSSPAFQNDRNSVLTTTGLTHSSKKGGRKRLHLDSSKGGVSRSAPDLHYLENRDGTSTKTSERTVRARMASIFTERSVKNRDTPKQTEGEWRHTSLNPPNKDCNKGEIKPVIHGNFYITGQLEANIPNVGYQSDAVSGQERIRGQQVSGSEESWQRLQPVVECGDDAMTLTVRRRRAVQLLLDRDNESSVPLSQLPPQCGYSVQTSWRDLSLMAQYDACHVTQEADSYVLPLLWRGTPVKMSCPASQIQPQAVGPPSPLSLCCSSYAMTVRVQGLSATEELRVNVRGEWTPLVVLAEQCGYTVDRQVAEIIFTAPFSSCGITVKGGTYILSIQMREKTFTVACPTSPPDDVPVTHQPPVTSPHITRVPTENLPETLEPFPWAPPFYLAPPYYPHPTYHYMNPIPDRHDAYNPLTPSSSTPEPIFDPKPFPDVASQPHYQDYYSHQIPVRESYKHFSAHSSPSSTDNVKDSDLVQQKQETPVLSVSEKQSAPHSSSSDAGFPMQVPPLQAPSHAVTQYYHYYHHPKIPLPDLPQDPHPAPGVPSLTNPQDPVLPRSIQQSEALSMFNSDQFFQPVPEAASYPHTPPTTVPYTPYPPQPYPYHYLSYFPHIARGEAKRSSPDKATKTNLSDRENTKSSTFVHPLPRSSHQGHDEYKFNPNPDDKTSPEWIKHPLWSDDIKAELEPPKLVLPHERPSLPTPSPNHNLPPYLYYYFPYYYYYQMYYGPESYPASPSSSKEAFDPLLQTFSSPLQHPSYGKPQTPSTKSRDEVHHGPTHPYYNYYQLYYKPEASVDNQDSKSESQLHSNSDYSWMGWLVHAAEAGYPSIPQSSPFYSTYSHGIAHQHPYDRLGNPDGEEEAAERLDNERKDQLKANLYTPSASPCGLGSVSDFDCIVSSGCCSYPVKDCTVGQHLNFAMPDVVEPTVATPAHPSEVNVSSTLQRVTSDPDIYIVPLDGCGVNKQVLGQTVVHLLAVQGSVHENSPVRLMVECSSSPGSPGEVRLHVLDQPLPPPAQSMPATVTVQLRIATDESFSSFHPEAHLPLSNIQGRPVYVEVSLLDPPVSGLVLLVHSCLAYTQAPYTSWMLVHDGCPSRSNQLLPSPHPDHIQRIRVTSFLTLPSESPPYMTDGGYSHLKDPEIFFVCLTEVCSNADGDCTVGCINSPND